MVSTLVFIPDPSGESRVESAWILCGTNSPLYRCFRDTYGIGATGVAEEGHPRGRGELELGVDVGDRIRSIRACAGRRFRLDHRGLDAGSARARGRLPGGLARSAHYGCIRACVGET